MNIIKFGMLLLALTTGMAMALPEDDLSGQEDKLVPESAAVAMAQPETLGQKAPSLGWGQVVKSVGTVLAVLGVLVGLNLYIRRRSGQWKVLGGRRIRLVEQLAFDARRRLVLVEVGGRNVLLAVTPQQVSALTEWPVEGAAGEVKAS